ncbi:MAG: hypothetical protein GF355_08535 [Candidatus Eisenbacteria bacterium]|nr:hypothetical protein [Candidatus Eisenbacteria bacterium]
MYENEKPPKELRWVVDLLERAGRSMKVGRPERHPSSEELTEFVETGLDAEADRALRSHLGRCRDCAELVALLEESMADEAEFRAGLRDESRARETMPDVVEFLLRRIKRIGMRGPMGELALAAKGREPAGDSGELIERGSARLGVSEGPGGELVVSMEWSGRPVSGATVSLVETDETGSSIEHDRGVTTATGEATLGPLADYPSPRPGWKYQVRVEMPGTTGSEG